jgi:hypothetical protein
MRLGLLEEVRLYITRVINISNPSALDTEEPAALPRSKSPHRTQSIGGWVGPRTDLDMVMKRKISTPAGNQIPTPEASFGEIRDIYFMQVEIS